MCSLEWMDVGREHGRFNLLEALGERQEGARNPRKEAADILLPHWCRCWIRVFLSVDGATFGHRFIINGYDQSARERLVLKV